MTGAPRLSRAALPHPEPVPPVRIVHLGLGAFHRSHQAWYTAHADDAAGWGIAAFTGRRPGAAEVLRAQQGVYTLVERGGDGDRFELIGSIVAAHPGDEVDALLRTFRSPEVALVTLTITEAGYRLGPDGELDLGDTETLADIALLRDTVTGTSGGAPRAGAALAAPATALGRLLLGLCARREAGAPPVAIVPCDNLPENGRVLERALTRMATEVQPDLAAWLPRGASFVSTSVDRITPRLDPDDRPAIAAATGWDDATPVVAEPFADWVLSGDFPSGRPRWESAGARFVDDIAPWEARKLWMLNGAHTLLAAAGPARGHVTVAEAFADPGLRAAVDRIWDEAAAQLETVETVDYRRALADRFANPRIVHRLAQIAEGSRTKVRLRIVPVALAERSAARPAAGCAAAIAAWIAAEAPDADPRDALRELSPELAADERFVRTLRGALAASAPSGPTQEA
ncbi:mannitol dehydrogenase family protein [Leifsonia sp. NPDC080035]|uniref:Mannitol dehydrogenase family protein n=1 Tax=Leifsonia sp. NPDC080035 TaxID=3143936 RepID=A0AAU7GFN7_9MICO